MWGDSCYFCIHLPEDNTFVAFPVIVVQFLKLNIIRVYVAMFMNIKDLVKNIFVIIKL